MKNLYNYSGVPKESADIAEIQRGDTNRVAGEPRNLRVASQSRLGLRLLTLTYITLRIHTIQNTCTPITLPWCVFRLFYR